MSERSSDNADWDRFAAYIANECTPDEAASVEEWLAADPTRRALLDALREAGARTRARADDALVIDAEAEWRRMEARLRAHSGEPVARAGRDSTGPGKRASLPWHSGHAGAPTGRILPLRRSSVRRPRWHAPAAIAAALLVAAGVIVVSPASRHDRSTAAAGAPPMREYVTARGQRAQLDLADGTRIVLAPASRLSVPVDMTAGPRSISLDGEALFTVAHDARRPFTVHTAHGVARDVGTTFVVTAYRDTQGMQVVVADGSVSLRRLPSQPLITLTRGDLARLDTTGAVTLRRDVDVKPYLSWTRDTLVFVAAPLRDVAPVIGRWYDLDVRLADSAIAGRHLAARFGDEPASAVLKLIALSLDLRVEQHGRTVTFYPLHHDGTQTGDSASARGTAEQPIS